MRNLKRALSLALASVMLLGMMVVGTSAASYPDIDENDNVEAIEVLNAVKVMIGDRGNFRPDAKVNRHEMAVIMAKLVLGNDVADNYVGTHPFTDTFPWADKYVAACYENDLISGRGGNLFAGNQPLKAVEAASMMLRALGYKDLNKGADDWRAPLVSMANQLRLFNGVTSNPNEELDRNQVAQLVLNTLKSSVVDLKDGTFNISDGNGQIIVTGGNREYIVRSSRESYAYAINDVESAGTSASSVSGATIELGEHLYNGDLCLYDGRIDAFGRPARTWEYKGEEVGTYVKNEMLRKDESVKVTGKMLYDLLSKNTIDTYDFVITIDGVATTDAGAKAQLGSAWFDTSAMTRTNDKAVGATNKGVTTEVYVDTKDKVVYIAIINTYLAIASEDYDEKNDDVDLTVYKIDDAANNSRNPVYVKTAAAKETINVSGEDFVIKDVAKDDMFLVNVAEGEIKVMREPEVISDTTIHSFAKQDWIKTSSAQYDYASTAMYDTKVLDKYDNLNMKELTYNVILDQYGYLIGLERNEDPDQYVFLTGLEAGASNLSAKNVDGNVIHMDGTMKTVTVDLSKSKNGEGKALTDGQGTWYTNLSQMNTWCTYSVSDSGVYTLKQVKVATTTNPITTGSDLTAAQYAQDVATYDDSANGGRTGEKSINTKRVSLNAASAAQYVYGNDKTVYINAELKKIPANDMTGGRLRWIINDVQSVTTGVKNANLTMKDLVDGVDGYHYPDAEVYTLYNDDGYVIAAVTIGEEDGASATFAYITSADVKYEEYGHSSGKASSGKWAWYREAIVDGEKVMLTEGGDNLTMLGAAASQGGMKQGEWYEIKTNADGEVRKADNITWTATSGVDEAKYIREVQDVEKSVNKFDTVLLSDVTSATALRFNGNGTLYTEPTPSQKGFSVSPDVKVIVATADENRKEFDKISDTYTGYSGLEKALNQMNVDTAKFNARTVEVNAILKDGRAEVIIINDTNPADSKGSGISTGGGKYYDYEANIFSNGMARVNLTAYRPEWVTTGVALDYTFDVMVNGKLYDTVLAAAANDIAVNKTEATTTWSNWTMGWGVPLDQGDVVTVANFKWVDLDEQTYKIKFIDQNNNELTVGSKATDDLVSGAGNTVDELAYNTASGTAVTYKFNGTKWTDGTSGAKHTVLGAHAAGGHVDIKDVAAAAPTSAVTVGTLLAHSHDGTPASGSNVVDLEDYVYVKIDTTGMGHPAATYSVKLSDELNTKFDTDKVFFSNTGSDGTATLVKTLGLHSDADAKLTLTAGTAAGTTVAAIPADTETLVKLTAKITVDTDYKNWDVTVVANGTEYTLPYANKATTGASVNIPLAKNTDLVIESITVTPSVAPLAVAGVQKTGVLTYKITFNNGVENGTGEALVAATNITVKDSGGNSLIGEVKHDAGSNAITVVLTRELIATDVIVIVKDTVFNTADPANDHKTNAGDKLGATNNKLTVDATATGNVKITGTDLYYALGDQA